MKNYLLILALINCLLFSYGNAQNGCLINNPDYPDIPSPSQTFIPTCSGHYENISFANISGRYAFIQLTAGHTYIFSSSKSTDLITIGDENGTVVLAAGFSSVSYESTSDQIVRFYTHLDEDCSVDGVADSNREKRVQCGNIQPPVENDECEDAIPLACGDSSSGTTTIATDSGGYPYADVFYSYTGSGEEEIVTVSLCGSDYDTYLRIYTDCTLSSLVAYNDNKCGEQSEITFVSDGVSTYYIMVEGYGIFGETDYVGDYVINVSCEAMPEAPENCSDHLVLDNNMEDGYFFEFRTFADIPVGDNGFIVEGLELSAFFAGTFFEVALFSNLNSLPGTEIATTTTQILSEEVYGSMHGFDFLNYTLEFDQPLTLEPNTVYWMEVISDAGGWVITYDPASIIGRFALVDDGTGFIAPGGEFVYKLVCEEVLNTDDLEKFNFSYYPNPTNDVLSFKSDQEIKSVSIYNLAEQKVLTNSKITNGQLNLSSLPTGTYVFRVELESGQIETFKIIKK